MLAKDLEQKAKVEVEMEQIDDSDDMPAAVKEAMRQNEANRVSSKQEAETDLDSLRSSRYKTHPKQSGSQ